jgi:hypothetical protein
VYTQIANKLLCIYRFDQPVPKFDALTAKLEIREHSISNLRFVGGVVLDGWGGTGCSLPLVYLGGGGKCVYTDCDFCVYTDCSFVYTQIAVLCIHRLYLGV